MRPVQRPGEYVFVTLESDLDSVPTGLTVLASVVEDEGLSVVVPRSDADRAGLTYDFVAGWITLTVHSGLAAVGLTAGISAALTRAGISANVIAGFHHDHILVPSDRVDDALNALSTTRRQSLTGLGSGRRLVSGSP